MEAGYSVLFLSLEGPMTRLFRAKHENRLERALQQLTCPKVLILWAIFRFSAMRHVCFSA